MIRKRWLIALAAIATVFTVAAADYADARAGRGGSFGSRGSNTFSAPPATQTAPRAAQPIQRSATQPGAATTGAAQAARPGMFGGGMLGGLAAGFLGAGLFGMLFGGGFLAGMGSFASILGLIFQIVLVVIVARLAFNWWQRRNNPQAATANAASQGTPGQQNNAAFTGLGGALGGGNAAGGMFGGGKATAAPVAEPLTIEEKDFTEFETLLTDVQAAYSAEDLNALRANVTPEMLSYFAEQIEGNAAHGQINRITDVKLLQGDLAEAWRENNDEYATVAMRFALKDSVVDRATGQVIETAPTDEATELWTFRRSRGAPWMLSAIQQA